MVLQEKLVDFDNEIVLQPANVVALFFQRAKDATEAVEDDDAAADKGPENTATKQTFESEDATADEDTAKQTFGSEDTAAEEDATAGEDATNTATKETFESEDAAAADEDTAKQTFGSADAAIQTFGSADTAADEDAAKQTCGSADTANTATKQTFPKHGPPVRKIRYNAPSSGKRVRKQPIGPHFQGRLSGREPRSHEFAPVGGSPGVRRRYIRIWLPFSRRVCLPERETLLHKWGEGGGKTSGGKYRQRFGKSPGETRLHADGPCAHGRGWRHEKQHNTRNNLIARIERDTLHKANRKWKEIHPKEEIAGILWRNTMFPKFLWRSCTAVYMFSKNAWWAMDTESTASTTHRIFLEFWTATRLWTTLVLERRGISARQSTKKSRQF